MSTPVEPLPPESYAAFQVEPRPSASAIDPDDPPWGIGTAAFAWLSSVALLLMMQALAVVPYAFLKYRPAKYPEIVAALANDPNTIVLTIISVVPAHLLTLGVVWALVTQFGKRPFWPSLGWSFSKTFGLAEGAFFAALALALLVVGALLTSLLGGEKTPFDQMMESSTTARFLTAFLATATAPLIEELIYRGMLYPALKRAVGMFWSVVVVSTLFTFVHIAQYVNNYGVITTIALLAFVLTYVRARTGRLLPCFIIHIVFNGVQVIALIAQYFLQLTKPDGATKTALLTLTTHMTGLRF
ncbi:MAG: CPBP family intramembrane metalloprotease [Acidobacteriota bacterium]|nr:CPBP family intramembrane metalloprotease [Acidobacteriota bacterium]